MIRPKNYIHPEGEDALRNMEAIPGFADAMKVLMKYYHEQYSGISMASKIRLLPSQRSALYNKLAPLCAKLAIAVSEFYLEMNPTPNAYAFGDVRTMIIVTSGFIEYLTPEEVDSIISYDCGYIACRHMLYHFNVQILINKIGEHGILGNLIMPVVWPILFIQIWEMVEQSQLDEKAISIAEGYIVSNQDNQLSAASRSGKFCTVYGSARLSNINFCNNSGTKK